MRDDESQYDRICKNEFEEINKKLDRMDVSLRGNGHPGITTRLDRLERSARVQSKLIWIVLLSFMSAAAMWIIK